MLFNKYMSLYEDDYSSDEEEVIRMINEFDPDLLKQAGGKKLKQLKKLADKKMVSPYLLGSFVNGELTIPQVAQLGDRRSRRRLFKSIA